MATKSYRVCTYVLELAGDRNDVDLATGEALRWHREHWDAAHGEFKPIYSPCRTIMQRAALASIEYLLGDCLPGRVKLLEGTWADSSLDLWLQVEGELSAPEGVDVGDPESLAEWLRDLVCDGDDDEHGWNWFQAVWWPEREMAEHVEDLFPMHYLTRGV